MINDLGYKNAILYCLSVSTFMNADGDGCGDFDFSGLMNRLDYLHGMGITAIWLMHFNPLHAATTDTMLRIIMALTPLRNARRFCGVYAWSLRMDANIVAYEYSISARR
ncbi:MAG TPA: alpha-amylase family glycosyl hydrolase [Acidobacteriaceae bacterium]